MSQNFPVTSPNFFKRFALKTKFSANLICKKFEAGKLKFFPKLRLFMLQFTEMSPPDCTQRPSGLAQAGLSLPFGRAQNSQICTNFRASHCPACAKPPVICWHHYSFTFQYRFLLFTSSFIILLMSTFAPFST